MIRRGGPAAFMAVRVAGAHLRHLETRLLCTRTTHRYLLLAAETIQGAVLALERVDNIHGGDGFPARVLGVGHGVADEILKEDLELDTGLLVDDSRAALVAAMANQTADPRRVAQQPHTRFTAADRGLFYALAGFLLSADVEEHFAVTLGLLVVSCLLVVVSFRLLAHVTRLCMRGADAARSRGAWVVVSS